MAAGKRLEGEDFIRYRIRLARESKELKARQRGTLKWLSSALLPDQGKEFAETPIDMRPLKKYTIQGTYKKTKGGNK